jgi:hypothetical protein
MLVGTVVLLLHVITCVWFALGSARDDVAIFSSVTGGLNSPGWIEQVFQGSEKQCACYSNMYYDPLERMCVSRIDFSASAEEICDGTSSDLPSLTAYYFQSAFTVFQDPSVSDSYSNSLAEMMGAGAVTTCMGFLWGAVAGAWCADFEPTVAVL